MKITKVYAQELPAVRFIGKKYGDGDRVNGFFGAKWGEFFAAGHFEAIEKAAGGAETLSALYEDGGAYLGFMRAKEGEPFEYWIGEFTPVGTPAPEGLEYFDLPARRLGVGWLLGPENELYGREGEVMKKLDEAGFPAKPEADGMWQCFERYVCPRFTTPDDKGNVTLDICFFINKN